MAFLVIMVFLFLWVRAGGIKELRNLTHPVPERASTGPQEKAARGAGYY